MVASNSDLHRANNFSIPPSGTYITLFEFWRKSTPTVIERVANNGVDVVSNGQTYQRGQVIASYPDSDEGNVITQIAVSNLDRVIGIEVLGSTEEIICRQLEVNSSDFDTVLRETYNLFKIVGEKVNGKAVTGQLYPRLDIRNEPIPPESVTEIFFPGLG